MEMQNLSVLFLEDSEKDIEIVYQKLSDDLDGSIQMDTAANEQQFLNLLRNNQFDVILADYTLPGYNAVSALEQSQKICPATPFICVSGTIGEDLAVEMLKQGASDYVIKDRLQRLTFAIRRAIQSKLVEQEREKAEQTIKEMSQSNRLIIDSTNDGIVMMDRDGNILNINEKFARRVGKTVEDVIGMNFKTFLPEEIFGDMYQQRLKRLRKAFDTGQPEIFEDSRNGMCFYNRFYPIFKDGNVTAVTLFSTDITDRVKAEEDSRRVLELQLCAAEQKKSEIELFEILDAISDGSWVRDLQNGTVKLPEATKTRLGLNIEGDIDIQEFTSTLIHPDDISKNEKLFEQCIIKREQRMANEYRVKQPDGNYKWMLGRVKFSYDESGIPLKAYGASIDITDRKKTEEALRESEARFRSVLDNSCDIIYRLNLQTGHFEYVSPSVETVLGYTPEQYMAMSSEEALAKVHPDDLSVISTAMTRLNETGYAESVYRQRGKSGEYRWVSNNTSLTRDSAGKPLYRNGNIRDITERKLKEEELRESEEKYQLLYNSIGQGFFVIDVLFDENDKPVDMYYVEANKAATDILGFNFIGKRLREINPDYEEYWYDIFGKVAKTGESVCLERYSMPDDKWFNFYVFKIEGSKGRRIGNIFFDITERKRAEEAIRESEEKYRMLFDTMDEGFCIIEKVRTTAGQPSDFRYLTANPAFEKHSGLVNVIGKTILELVPGADTEIMDIYDNVALSGQSRHFESYIRARDYWLEAKVCPTQIPGQIAVLFSNITERKKADEALSAAYRQIQNIIDNTPDIVYAFDLEERFVLANTALAQLFNTTPEQLLGKRRHEIMPKEDADWHEVNDRKAIKENRTLEFEEYSQLESRSITWLTKKFPLRDTQERIYAVAGISADISERKRTEETLRESEIKAKALVAELEEADKNKNEFISVLSHELRNPLAAIVAGLSLLEISEDKQQRERAEGIINRQIKQLCKLVDDLLELTRITQNKIKIKKELINLNEVVINAIKDLEPEFEKKGIQLIVETTKRPVFLDADPVRITQAIGNILFNALKFTEKGGVVNLTLRNKKNEAEICIKDNGTGIIPEMLAQLFKPFTQADNSLHRNGNGGLGLGLSIVKGIVDMHDGNVTASSEGLGKGAEFTIHLPIKIEIIETEDSIVMDKTKHNYRILTIEDNKDFADILCAMFDMLGHESFTAYNGMDGIAKAKEIRPDVIFCDIGLPGKDGYEVAKIIKEDDELKNVYLIALTGYVGKSEIERAAESGFDRHLAKPVDMNTLGKILFDIDR